MEGIPDFTQIPLKKDALFALDDLQASSGYGRHLILPDDVPPVLSVPQIQGTIKPRLVTGQDDGAVNVFITGQSGGGGAAAPVITPLSVNQMGEFHFGAGGFHFGATDGSTGTKCAFFHASAYLNSTTQQYGAVVLEFGMTDHANVSGIHVCLGKLMLIADSANPGANGSSGSLNVTFPDLVNLAAATGFPAPYSYYMVCTDGVGTWSTYAMLV